jgi:uncharacterized membrane protein YhhN
LGDVFLMLPRDRFLLGLVSFLAAHVAYILAFTSGVPLGGPPPVLLALVTAAALLVWRVWPSLGPLRIPVLGYTATILLMVWQAWGRHHLVPGPATAFAAVGATLFMTSDALLALNRFWRPLPLGQALIISTYVGAQALIALSAVFASAGV